MEIGYFNGLFVYIRSIEIYIIELLAFIEKTLYII